MESFSVTRAATAGFRLMRDRPGAMAAWGLLYLAFFAIMAAVMLTMMLPLLQSVFTSNTTRPPDQVLLQLWSAFVPMMLVILPASLLFAAVTAAAVYRAALRPQEGGFAFLRLGADELRQLAVLLLLSLAAGVIFAPLFFGLFFGIGAASTSGDSGSILAVIAAVPILMCLYVFLLVRFSLAPVATFAEKRIVILGSWRLTSGRFWPLVGMYLLVWVFTMVVGLVAAVVAQIFLGIGPMEYFTALAPQPGTLPDLSHLPAMGPAVIIGLIGYAVTNVAAGLFRVVLYYAAPASAYAQLTGDSPETTGEVFS